jgi:hypothetical protein
MKKNERLKAIVREWLEYKLGFPLSDKLAIKMVAEIIETEDEKPKETWREALDQSQKDQLEDKEDNFFGVATEDKLYGIRNFNHEPKEESDWISVTDRMPEESEHRFSENVLIYYSLGLILIGFTHRGFWRRDAQTLKNEEVTHWRHLPEPPKQ